MVGQTQGLTSADRNRIDICKRMIGCLPCLLVGKRVPEVDYHHIVEGHKRLGHEWGYPMCRYHHRGEECQPCGMKWHREVLGPSYALERKLFRATFGPEPVLAMTTTMAVQLAIEEPWPDFDMPEDAMRRIQELHWSNRAMSGIA